MIKGAYLYSEGIAITNMVGVLKKIDAQVKSFNNNDLNCTLYKIRTIKNTLFFKKNNCNEYFNINDINEIKYIYIRKPGTVDYRFLNMLKSIKRLNHSIKIVLELPTYPYDAEFGKNIKGYIKLIVDKIFRSFLYKYVDYIAILTNDKIIFNIKTLEIDNGLDFSSINIRDCSLLSFETIDLCAVASFYGSHGYDRLLRGMFNYYKCGHNNKIVNLHLVGDGPELPYYRSLVNNYNIEKYVFFHGVKDKEGLKNIYSICDASIGSLGAYRKNIFDTKELKSTESMAYGIPFICGCKSARLTSKGYKYFLELPNDNSDIDINEIVKFINDMYKNEDIDTITTNIREFGEKYFNMDACMKNVIEYFKS